MFTIPSTLQHGTFYGIPYGGSSECRRHLNIGSYRGLSPKVLSYANVVSSIKGLKIFNSDNTLRDSCGMTNSSVDQPPRVLDNHRPFVLIGKHPHNISSRVQVTILY
uniref:Uncharacterized protein n=1 Tax=Varanus komodoensis TaxID=61221 RepID=A0A8D2LXB7_VARKO